MSEQTYFEALEIFKEVPKGPFFSENIVRTAANAFVVETAFGMPLRVQINEDGYVFFVLLNENNTAFSVSAPTPVGYMEANFDDFITSFLLQRGLETGSDFYTVIPEIFGQDKVPEILVLMTQKLYKERYTYAKIISEEWVNRLVEIVKNNNDYVNVYDSAGFPIVIDLDNQATRRITLQGCAGDLLIVYTDDNERDNVVLYKGRSNVQPEFVLNRLAGILCEYKNQNTPAP